MTVFSKNIYFVVLDDIVNEYNNTVHKTIKMKPIDITDDYYIKSNGTAFNGIASNKNSMKLHSNKKNPKCKVGDNVRISKYKNIFAKGYTPNWSGEVFVINKIKNTAPWTYVINNLNGEEITGSFYQKELQKTNQKEFRIEKVLKKRR